MMNLLSNLRSFFLSDELEKQIIATEIIPENIRRIFYLSLIAVPVSLAHVIIFGLQLNSSTGIEHNWRLGIFFIHLTIVFILSIIAILVYFFSIKPQTTSIVARVCVSIISFLLIIGGSVVATVDQMVTTAINPYIVASLVVSIVILVRPANAIIFYLVGYTIFYYSISLTQHNPDVLVSNRVNGITIAGVALCLSFIFWRLNLVRIKQGRLINNQKEELEINYDKLRFYSEELKETNATKDKLFSIIAHDLKTPFSSILGLTHILAHDLDLMTKEELKNTLKLLNRDASLSFETLSNLLDWSRTQQEKIKPQPQSIELNRAIQEILFELEGVSNVKNIEIKIDILPDICVLADPAMLRSIIKNLITNAIKFTNKGGTIALSTVVKNQFAEICVRDNGIGIAKDRLKKIIKKNSGETTPGTDNEQGTGLGLQICKDFVELNGGKLNVHSEIGKGSSFCFTIPLSEEDKE